MAKVNLEDYIPAIGNEDLGLTPSNESDAKVGDTEHHSLFRTNLTPEVVKWRLFVGDFFEEGTSLNGIMDTLLDSGPEDFLEAHIHSNGGSIDSATRFLNVIKNKFPKRNSATLNNKGRSMGALTFCAFDKRVIYENSDIMFHNYSSLMMGKGGEIGSQVDFSDDTFDKMNKDLVVGSGFLTEEEYNRMVDGKDYWFTADEMCRRGIATHVMVSGVEMTAKDYLTFKEEN